MTVDTCTPLPEGIVTMLPGPELGAALATVDPATVPAGECAALLLATRRQLSRAEAVHARALRECALADPDAPGGRCGEYHRHSSGEPRAVLGESRTRIDRALDLAETAFERLPALGAAWTAGDLDTDRVRVFADRTRALSVEHAGEVVETVLPEALLAPGAGLTLSALIERISEVAAALDPTWAARTYDNAAAQARVRARRTDAGTVNLSGLDLPLDAATRSTTHITALAARAKAAGHSGGIDTIRARVYLLLLSPRTEACDDDALLAHLLATAPTVAGAGDPHGDPGHPDDAPPERHEASRDPDETGADETGADETGASPNRPGPAEPPAESDAQLRLPRRARIELHVALSTLLGLDQRPARMPGHGILHADLARELALSHSRGQWRVAVVDGDGELAATLLTRRRPHGHTGGPPLTDGTPPAIVEIHVTEHRLAALDPRAHPAWAAVLRDLQHQLRAWQRARAEDTAAPATGERDRPTGVAARRRARAREASQRFPTAPLRRWVESRDRVCTFPPCGASATRCDIDHTLAVVTGGITVPGNLGPACRHDHDAKTTGGWTLDQYRPGHFTWTSPTGNHYAGRTPKIIPDLPPPLPPEHRDRSDPLPAEYADHGPMWHDDPYPRQRDEHPEPPRGPAPAERREPDDDPPPF